MRQSDVVRSEVPSMGPESWVVVRRRGPIGTRRPRIEVPAAPEAVALRHLATRVDDLAVPGELQEDSANSKGLKLLNSCLSGGKWLVAVCLAGQDAHLSRVEQDERRLIPRSRRPRSCSPPSPNSSPATTGPPSGPCSAGSGPTASGPRSRGPAEPQASRRSARTTSSTASLPAARAGRPLGEDRRAGRARRPVHDGEDVYARPRQRGRTRLHGPPRVSRGAGNSTRRRERFFPDLGSPASDVSDRDTAGTHGA